MSKHQAFEDSEASSMLELGEAVFVSRESIEVEFSKTQRDLNPHRVRFGDKVFVGRAEDFFSAVDKAVKSAVSLRVPDAAQEEESARQTETPSGDDDWRVAGCLAVSFESAEETKRMMRLVISYKGRSLWFALRQLKKEGFTEVGRNLTFKYVLLDNGEQQPLVVFVKHFQEAEESGR